MVDMPTPMPADELIKVQSVEMVQRVQKGAQECYYFPSASVAVEEDLLAYAKFLRDEYSSGFEWGDLLGIVKSASAFLDRYSGMSEEEKHSSTIKIIDHIIDITDTPYLPDNISDPVCKAFVPPFVELMFSLKEGRLKAQGIERYGTVAGRPEKRDVSELLISIKELLNGDFSWDVVFNALTESFAFFFAYDTMLTHEKEEAIYGVLAFIVDETSWPYHLDFILDPLTKAILPPVIEMVVEG